MDFQIGAMTRKRSVLPVLASVAAAIIVLAVLAGRSGDANFGMRFYSVLPTVSGLSKGREVTLFRKNETRDDPGAVVIGNILSLESVAAGVRVELTVDAGVDLRENARVIFQPANASGGGRLMIDPGAHGAALSPNSEIPGVLISSSPDGLLEPPPRWAASLQNRYGVIE